MAFAHSRNDHGQRHDLVAHLRGVGELARRFAEPLGAPEAGRYAGLWHDLGKFHPAFQAYLLACERRPDGRGRGPDHKAAGARLALKYLQPAALLIQGHHGGLRSPTELRAWLAEHTRQPAVAEALSRADAAIPDLRPTARDGIALPAEVQTDRRAAELFLRLLFSALVDADYLDTEGHFDAERGARRGTAARLSDLWERFTRDQANLSGQRDDAVNRVRHEVYQACLQAADHQPGLFRLAVPTGGGKTRSALAFALRHALQHDLRQIVVAVPFITITEQTADVYRSILARPDDPVPVLLEHHSGVVREGEAGEDFHSCHVWERLAAENWDALVTVTTTVQLFESLFSASPSACRKLHRLAQSVIILDEAQALPAHLLRPILDVLQHLVRHYGTTVVLSTATQPAFDTIPEFAGRAATDVIPDATKHFELLRRVEYEWQTNPRLAWDQVADLMRSDRQALAVINTKKDALALLDALDDPAAFHLSTLLCGAHRRVVLRDVRNRLKAGQPCRLVSTQVVEAGVDLDFPLVLRALGPLDSIIQAAGRCNRSGRLERGRVIIFDPADGGLPAGTPRVGAAQTQVMRSIQLSAGSDLDLHDPAVARDYFLRLFQTLGENGTDREGIQALRQGLDYPAVSRAFRMIDDDTESVIVPYGDEAERRAVTRLIDQLGRGGTGGRELLRRIQPYLVTVRSREAERYRRNGFISDIRPGLGEWHGAYDPVRGLVASDPSPDLLVI